MTRPSPERIESSPNAERLRLAMGWERLPEMSPEQREEGEAERRRGEEVRRFYGESAA